MKYPKKVMTITELADMGFPKRLLTNYTHIANQGFAFKTAENGKWLFDTEEFDKFIHSFGKEEKDKP